MNKADALNEINQAIENGMNANLQGANLQDADLRHIDLQGANLQDADLRDANLRDANLRNADLRDANLRDANLRNANLQGANLQGANLPVFNKWTSSWKINGVIAIGCKRKAIEEWDAWFAGNDEYFTARHTEAFEYIEAEYQHLKRMYEIYKKYNNINNKE